MIARRRANAARLTEALRPLEERILLPRTLPDRDHSFMMYPLVVRDERKTGLVEWLELHGVETRDMMPLVDQPALEDVLVVDRDALPATQWINASGLYVGCHQDLGEADMDRLAELIHAYFQERG